MQKAQENRLIRRNWGYWDGRLMAELGKPYLYAHFDRHYLAGWQDGYHAYRSIR